MEEPIGAKQESTEKSDSGFYSLGELPCHIKIEDSNFSGDETNAEQTPDYKIDIFEQDLKEDYSERLESNFTNLIGECLVIRNAIYPF